jgi:YD repeat-containing protein
MKIDYDPEVDALYIRFAEGPAEVTTQRLTEEVAIDYDADGRIVGIEILDASESVFPPGQERRVVVRNLRTAHA